jgi:hypothetical protein
VKTIVFALALPCIALGFIAEFIWTGFHAGRLIYRHLT